jgi:cytidylate kinase
MVALQRRLIASGDWVVEGRDIGTVVAPDADLKLFLTADPGERARRRSNQSGATIAAVESELRVRDTRDSERVHSPLSEAPDAVKLDTTGLSIDDVLDEISKLVGR